MPHPWLHSALTVLLHPAWSWEMLSKTCSPSALGRLLFPRLRLPGSTGSSCHLQLPNGSQQGSTRPRASVLPVRSGAPASSGSDRHAGGRKMKNRGRPPPNSGPFPGPPLVGLGGGGEGSTLSALRNVLWENAEAIIPSYFPWLTPRYSAGPLHSQAPAPPLGRGRREESRQEGLKGFTAVLLWFRLYL